MAVGIELGTSMDKDDRANNKQGWALNPQHFDSLQFAVWQRPICFFMLPYPPVQGFVLILIFFRFGWGALPPTPHGIWLGGQSPPDPAMENTSSS